MKKSFLVEINYEELEEHMSNHMLDDSKIEFAVENMVKNHIAAGLIDEEGGSDVDVAEVHTNLINKDELDKAHELLSIYDKGEKSAQEASDLLYGLKRLYLKD